MDPEKNDGMDNNGITYEFIIPYSNVMYLFVYPVFKRTLVNMIGSKKNPTDDINLTDVVGNDIDKISLIIIFEIFPLLLSKYLFFIILCIINILTVSVIMLNSIKAITDTIFP